MERRFVNNKFAQLQVEQRADGDNAGSTIAGYAAVYYDGSPGSEYVVYDDNFGKLVERMLPGCFAGVISRPDDVRCTMNHNPDHLLGRTAAGTMKLSVDGKGLRYECDIPKTAIADQVRESIKRGDLNGSSFSFNVPPNGDRWITTRDDKGRRITTREVLSVVIDECGPVTFQAYPGTTAEARGNEVEVAELRKRAEAADLPAIVAESESRAREIELVEAME